MADTDPPVPQSLIDAQRAFDAAHAELMADTETVSVERRRELRQAERDAALALQAERASVEEGRWASVDRQKKVWAAARGQA
jgi:hypothetical protein